MSTATTTQSVPLLKGIPWLTGRVATDLAGPLLVVLAGIAFLFGIFALRLRAITRSVKARAEAETLRAALMDSVSHGLRTPLASIMGSASILVEAPSVKKEPHLADLAAIVRDEAERLDGDIQKLLDASTYNTIKEIAATAEQNVSITKPPQGELAFTMPAGVPPVEGKKFEPAIFSMMRPGTPFDDPNIKIMSHSDAIEVWLVSLPGTAMYVPYRIVLPTDAGPVSATSTSFHVEGDPRASLKSLSHP